MAAYHTCSTHNITHKNILYLIRSKSTIYKRMDLKIFEITQTIYQRLLSKMKSIQNKCILKSVIQNKKVLFLKY